MKSIDEFLTAQEVTGYSSQNVIEPIKKSLNIHWQQCTELTRQAVHLERWGYKLKAGAARMVKILVLIFLGVVASVGLAEDSVKPNARPKHPDIPFKDVGWRRGANRVGFSPVLAWYPNGLAFGAGPIVVSDDRRRVRIPLNIGFGGVTEVNTFNFTR